MNKGHSNGCPLIFTLLLIKFYVQYFIALAHFYLVFFGEVVVVVRVLVLAWDN